MTVVLDLHNQDYVLIHRGEINKILTVLQQFTDPKIAMANLKKLIPPAYTKKQLKIYQKWGRRDLKLRHAQGYYD